MSFNDPTNAEKTQWLLGYNRKWDGDITYAFAQNLSDMHSNPPNSTFAAVPSNNPIVGEIRTIAQLWDDLITNNIQRLSEADVSEASITIAGTDNPASFSGRGSLPPDGDLWLGGGLLGSDQSPGTVNFFTALHEFGHTIGLGHAGDYDGGSEKIPSSYQDSGVYSVMSYLGPHLYTPATGYSVQWANWSGSAPQTPMMNDILAIQQLYGADTTTRAEGGTVYGFNSTIQGETRQIYDFGTGQGQNAHPILCIYDAGGAGDRIDLSGWTTRSALSLIAGTFSNANGMTMNISISYTTSIEDAVTGSNDDLIVGNLSGNVLYGNEGNDVLYGGGGSDTFVGGRGNDNFLGAFEGISSNLIAAGYITAELAAMWSTYTIGDSPADIDTADYSSWRIGNAGMNSGIIVNTMLSSLQVTNDGFGTADNLIGIDRIVGTSMMDTFRAGAQNTWFLGEDGNDFFFGGTGANVFNGGADFDTVDYSGSLAGVTIYLDSTTGSGGDAQGDVLIGIEEIVGSQGIDRLYGDATSNVLYGGGGNDYLTGMLGNDFVYGDDGADEVRGHDGNDVLFGGSGNDLLDGGAGYDELYGGTGNDRLIGFFGGDKMWGGQGNDTFVFQNFSNWGSATVMDFESGDKIELSISSLGGKSISEFISTKIVDGPDGAIIDLQYYDVVFAGVSHTAFTSSDFLFV